SLYMRIVVGRDQFWPCHQLAAAVFRRSSSRYGLEIVIVHSDETGVAVSFGLAARRQQIRTEAQLADLVGPVSNYPLSPLQDSTRVAPEIPRFSAKIGAGISPLANEWCLAKIRNAKRLRG